MPPTLSFHHPRTPQPAMYPRYHPLLLGDGTIVSGECSDGHHSSVTSFHSAKGWEHSN